MAVRIRPAAKSAWAKANSVRPMLLNLLANVPPLLRFLTKPPFPRGLAAVCVCTLAWVKKLDGVTAGAWALQSRLAAARTMTVVAR